MNWKPQKKRKKSRERPTSGRVVGQTVELPEKFEMLDRWDRDCTLLQPSASSPPKFTVTVPALYGRLFTVRGASEFGRRKRSFGRVPNANDRTFAK